LVYSQNQQTNRGALQPWSPYVTATVKNIHGYSQGFNKYWLLELCDLTGIVL